MFVFLSSNGELIVKLPVDRVNLLVASGKGTRCDLAGGRTMKQWFAIGDGSLWLAKESMKFASSKEEERSEKSRLDARTTQKTLDFSAAVEKNACKS
jgi:hypothetical protein